MVLELDQALNTPLPCGAMLDVSLCPALAWLINLVHDWPKAWDVDEGMPLWLYSIQGSCLLIA